MKNPPYLRITPFIFCLFLICSCQSGGEDPKVATASMEIAPLPSLSGKKVLVVHGGWPGHKPALFAEVVSELLRKEGAEVLLEDSVGIYANEEVMSQMDLIIQSVTMDKINKDQIKGLVKAVKAGAGFAGAHGGFCDSFRSNTEYQFMTGAQFVAHPGGKIEYTVNITGAKDAITTGLEDFKTMTEQYYMHVDPNVKVLASTTFTGEHAEWIDGAVMPVVWKKYHGDGRIFCIALGHNPEEFHEKPAQDLLMNGLRWASGSKYEDKEEWLSPVVYQ